MESLRSWCLLRAVKGLGNSTLCRLVFRFGSPENVLTATIPALTEEEGVTPALAQAIVRRPERETLAQIDRELKALAKEEFSLLTILDPHYPPRLKMIPDPPPLLYMTGQFQEPDYHAVAIVGSRRGTPAGCTMTRQLSGNLAALGFTIVSGMARGIDAAAHQGALESSGRTVAVLGCGIDRTYPPEHRTLRTQIEGNGAVLSEFSQGTPPRGYHFPQRNRVISGLCLGVVVVEATTRSGSLITARLASEQNREVFAVPGPVHNVTSQGPHRLIKQGAKLVEGPEDILEELLPQLESPFRDRISTGIPPPTLQPPELEQDEQVMYDLITPNPVSLEELTSQGYFTPAEVMSILLSLELKGLIRQLPGAQYIRTSLR